MKSKEAKRRKQLKAQQRKRKLAEKQKTKKLARRPSTAALNVLVDGWLKLDPSALPVEARCPGCTGDIGAHAHGDELVLLHTEPHCASYTAFTRANDAANEAEDERAGGGISIDEVVARMVPEWTRGPSTEITEEEGEALMASNKVRDFTQMMAGGMLDGPSYAYARTEKGLFRWRLTDEAFDDEEEVDLDEDFDDEDEDEVSEVTAKPYGASPVAMANLKKTSE